MSISLSGEESKFIHLASPPHRAMFKADEPAKPAPRGESERVEMSSPDALKNRAISIIKASSLFPLISEIWAASTVCPVSWEEILTRPLGFLVNVHSARREIAAFSVCDRSWNRYKGQISSVPPARSIRVGAEECMRITGL